VVTVLVDAQNVRRSLWPNLEAAELVERLSAWAADEGVQALAVFDGPVPEAPPYPAVEVAGTESESADDRIAAEAAARTARGETVWLVTSDRGLRARAGGAAARTIGGGAFACLLTEAKS
jgi:predicted RNA-binding protein with PIN domain